jgi:RNA polymerase sigma-70 factor (ECF subfamily)
MSNKHLSGTDNGSTENFEELILLAQQGDKGSFRRIVELHRRFAFAAAFKILLNEEDAKDAAQESFIKLWKNINRYKFEAKFTTWFYKIVINESLDKLKARKRKENTMENAGDFSLLENLSSSGSSDFSNNELAEIIKKLTERLSPKQKIVFTLRDLNGLGIDDISASLNISESSVKANLVYARRKIKELLTSIYKWQ